MIDYLNTSTFVGIGLILSSLAMLAFPPAFGNHFYGIRTELTMQNEQTWFRGQKLYSYALSIMGITFISLGALQSFNISRSAGPWLILLLIVLWTFSKYIIHKILKRKISA